MKMDLRQKTLCAMQLLTFSLFVKPISVKVHIQIQRPMDTRTDMKRASEGAISSHKKMSQHKQIPIECAKPDLTVTTDETGVFVCADPQGVEKEAWFLVDASNKTEASNGSACKVSECELANGIRVKIMKTHSGTGTMAPVFVTVSGLTDAELTKEICPSGVLCFKIPGLAPGGSTDVHNTKFGHL